MFSAGNNQLNMSIILAPYLSLCSHVAPITPIYAMKVPNAVSVVYTVN